MSTPFSAPNPDHSLTLWDTGLIQKYDLTGPRYTSYPTALKFADTYNEKDWFAATTLNRDNDETLALYLHIPFCDTICYYCGCNKVVTANRIHAERYLTYLEKEIRLKACVISSKQKVDLIHFGGGTPTYLSDEQLQYLLALLSEVFEFDEASLECAIEIHPQTVSIERLNKLSEIGFNRISIGVQDFDPAVQSAVNRFNTKDEVQALILEARKCGFKSCSIDLIYGLPRQTTAGFSRTLDEVLELSPDRISVFNYAHMPHMFKSQNQINPQELPEPHEKLSMLHDCIRTLACHDYVYIGMDHFAKHGDELHQAQKNGKLHRNFQGYATHNHSTLHAFGLSAISTINWHYAQNVKRLDEYYELLDLGKLPLQKGYILNADDEIRRYIINTLLCQFKLSFNELRNDFDIDFYDYFRDLNDQIITLEKDGLIRIDNEGLHILDKGRLLARTVCSIFDAHTQSNANIQARFSRII